MENIVFYKPPSASKNRPLYLPGVLPSANVSGSFNPPLSAPSQSGYADGYCTKHTVQEQVGTLNSSKSDDGDDDMRQIDELLSGMREENNLNSDDDDFVDIDELLSRIKQERISASVKTNSGGMAEKVGNGIQGGSPADSSYSTKGSSEDPFTLSDDESVCAESDTDYSDLDLDPRAKSSSDPQHGADSKRVDSDGFGLRTTHISGLIVANPPGDGNDDNNNVVDDSQLHSPNRPRTGSPGHGFVTPEANRRQADTTQESASSVDFDATGSSKEDDDTHSTKRQKLSAPTVPNNNLVSTVVDDSNNGNHVDKSAVAAGSKPGARSRSKKRVRWEDTEDTEDTVATPSSCSPDVLDEAIIATSSGSVQESEEIPVHGYFTLKALESEVVYCLTFSQGLPPRPHNRGRRDDNTDLEEPRSAPVRDPNCQWESTVTSMRK